MVRSQSKTCNRECIQTTNDEKCFRGLVTSPREIKCGQSTWPGYTNVCGFDSGYLVVLFLHHSRTLQNRRVFYRSHWVFSHSCFFSTGRAFWQSPSQGKETCLTLPWIYLWSQSKDMHFRDTSDFFLFAVKSKQLFSFRLPRLVLPSTNFLNESVASIWRLYEHAGEMSNWILHRSEVLSSIDYLPTNVMKTLLYRSWWLCQTPVALIDMSTFHAYNFPSVRLNLSMNGCRARPIFPLQTSSMMWMIERKDRNQAWLSPDIVLQVQCSYVVFVYIRKIKETIQSSMEQTMSCEWVSSLAASSFRHTNARWEQRDERSYFYHLKWQTWERKVSKSISS